MDNNVSVNTGQKSREICIEALKKGDEKAFAHFVNTYKDMVFACCRSAGLRPEDVDDAASEAFIAAYRSIGRFKGNSKLSSWLWRIAYHKALTIYRKNRRRAVLNEDIVENAPADPMQTDQDGLESKEQSDLIWEAVDRLPENWAPAIVLFYREQKPVAEIAEILGIPANSVKTYLNRGRKRLYELLEKHWKNDYVKS